MGQSGAVDFTRGNLMRHVVVMSFTSSIGIMAIYVVDLFDIFFISLLGQREMAAAAGYGSTLLFFVSAINLGLSIAVGALVAQALGRGDVGRAREVATACAMCAVAVGIVLPVALFPLAPWLVGLIGAKGEVAGMAVGYFRIILPATALSGISMAAVVALRARGDARWSMYPSLCGALVNLILDPLLIFGLNMGLSGAATATVLARGGTMLVALYAATRRHDALAPPQLCFLVRYGRDIVRYSVPAVLSSVAAPVGQALLTRYFARYGAEAVAAMAVVGRLSPVVFSVINALSGAIGPIIGQNFGAGNLPRVREAFRNALIFLALYVAVVGLLLFLLRPVIADAFRTTGLTRDLLYLYCGSLAGLVAFFNGTIFVANAAYNNIGYPGYSTRLNWAKNTIGLWPFLALGSWLGGVTGVALGAVTCAGIFALLSVRIVQRLWNRPDVLQQMCDADDYEGERTHEMLNKSSEPIHV